MALCKQNFESVFENVHFSFLFFFYLFSCKWLQRVIMGGTNGRAVPFYWQDIFQNSFLLFQGAFSVLGGDKCYTSGASVSQPAAGDWNPEIRSPLHMHFSHPVHQSAVSLVQLTVKVKTIDLAATGGTIAGNPCTPAIIVDALIVGESFGPLPLWIRPSGAIDCDASAAVSKW